MKIARLAGLALTFAACLLAPRSVAAQTHHHHMEADTTRAPAPSPPPAHRHGKSSPPPPPAHRHDMGSPAASTAHHHDMSMKGLYGDYPMAREASGTAWQPERAGHHGIHLMRGSWMLMLHGMADVVWDDQGGDRGDEKLFSSNMVMGMARRAAGPGTLGLRAMLSAEPATIGKEGYPLLLQTGETANGRTHLIDRQHPHDLFMELAATYSIASGDRSLFLYGGLPGEPALGPPAFMHRISAMVNPIAPITHHWLDSSHITFGVLTGGVVWGPAKLEASAFRGREPDPNRWDIESPELDSHSFRLSLAPTPAWTLQVSRGRLRSPEQLEPEVDADRTTASVMAAGSGSSRSWGAMVAWGRNENRPGPTLDAFTAEAVFQLQEGHTWFARAETVEKNELFDEGDPREGAIFRVGEMTAGYRFDVWKRKPFALGLGVAGTLAIVPEEIEDVYGDAPAAIVVFTHLELR